MDNVALSYLCLVISDPNHIIHRPCLTGALVFFFQTIFVLIIIYMYTIIGLAVFSDREPEDPDEAYYAPFECNLGFDTLGCALFALFQQLTTSNWHEAMDSVISEFGYAASVYFVSFFIFVSHVSASLLMGRTSTRSPLYLHTYTCSFPTS